MENAFGQPQSVVVLGGTSDIATALVQRLIAARTRTVVLAGRDGDRLATAASAARAGGATTVATVLCDATQPESAGDTVTNAFTAANGTVDLVIVAVGALGHQLTDENDAVASARMAAINFGWPVAALAAVRGRLVAQGSGRIVVLSSVAAIRIRRASYLYGGAKAGLDRLCDGLADSLEGTGVTLQIVRPGFVHSKMTAGMTPTPFSTGVDEVADTIMKSLSSPRRVITSPPALQYVFLVLRHLPAGLWRRVTAER